MSEPNQTKLKELQIALDKLESQPLPVETRALLSAAQTELGSLLIEEEKDKEQRRLAALFQVSHTIGASLDLDVVLNQVMDAVIDLTSAERGFLFLGGKGEGKLELRAARNYDGEDLETKQAEVSQTVIDTVLENGEGVLSTDAMSDPRFSHQDSVVFYSLRSVMCAPLQAHGQVIGVIYVDHRAQTGVFHKDDLSLLSAFANQAASAIENARIYTRTDRALAQRLAELELVTHIDRDLNARLDFQHVLAIIQNWAIRGTGSSACQIYLVWNETLPGMSLPDQVYPITQDTPHLIHQILERQSPYISAPEENQLAQLMVPILLGDRPLGLILATRPSSYTVRDMQFLTRLAHRAATAIENSRLYLAVQQANLAKSQFVSVVTHELRAPMTAIRGYAELLYRQAAGPINEQQGDFLEIIQNNVVRMAALVSDLSDISRIESGQLKLVLERIQLEGCITEAIKNMTPRIEENELEVELKIPAGIPAVIADPKRVLQILENLLSNACKYTPKGGKVQIQAYPGTKGVRLEITDTGIGISPDDQAALFTQFFRADHPVVLDQPGWGLGLHVTRRLVELMGGEIGVKSALNQGSTFWFTLPYSGEVKDDEGA